MQREEKKEKSHERGLSGRWYHWYLPILILAHWDIILSPAVTTSE
jgi:hypothetical protein